MSERGTPEGQEDSRGLSTGDPLSTLAKAVADERTSGSDDFITPKKSTETSNNNNNFESATPGTLPKSVARMRTRVVQSNEGESHQGEDSLQFTLLDVLQSNDQVKAKPAVKPEKNSFSDETWAAIQLPPKEASLDTVFKVLQKLQFLAATNHFGKFHMLSLLAKAWEKEMHAEPALESAITSLDIGRVLGYVKETRCSSDKQRDYISRMHQTKQGFKETPLQFAGRVERMYDIVADTEQETTWANHVVDHFHSFYRDTGGEEAVILRELQLLRDANLRSEQEAPSDDEVVPPCASCLSQSARGNHNSSQTSVSGKETRTRPHTHTHTHTNTRTYTTQTISLMPSTKRQWRFALKFAGEGIG